MGWFKKLIESIFVEKDMRNKGKKDRYVPGGMDEHFSKDLEQPSKMFRRAFGDHYHDEE